MIKVINKTNNGADIISMKNDNIEVVVTNYGCTILKILVKDKHNIIQDVVLGFPTVEDYIKKDGSYLGAIVGRVANRIAKGKFILNGKTYYLAINNGPNTLHGGIDGFSYKLFNYKIEKEEVIFYYHSPDGEENFPGNLELYVSYRLLENGLKITYKASSDQDTIINITNHSYFNLSGHACNIEQHELMIKANYFACVDQDGLVTGELKETADTPFDFNQFKLIHENIYQQNEQLNIAKGYDHPFIFSDNKDQVKLYCSTTGIEMTVSTTLPQAQIYSANYLSGQLDKNNRQLHARDGICIETQNMPNSINQDAHPTVILKKGEVYEQMTSYTFKTR